MFHQFKLAFVLVLCMRLCLESHAASDICSICQCANSQTKIDCSSRGLNVIPGSIPTNVIFLFLHENNITYIQPGAFQNLPNLELLILYQNKITYIQPGAFQNLPNLEELDLGGNKLHEIDPQIFQNLTSLTRLVLHENNITYIQPGAFQNLPNLELLVLYQNNIPYIQPSAFQNLPNLYYLDLHQNNIPYIQPGVFQNLPNLEYLYLNQNNIPYIQPGTFQNLPNLKYLYLSNNKIQNYEDGAFLFLPSIYYIDLQDNPDMMCGCHLPALVNYWKSKFGRTVNVAGECKTDLGNSQTKVIPIMEYSQCQKYSLFQRNLQCQTCSGVMCNSPDVTNCTGDEAVCKSKITTNGVTLKFEKSCSTYTNCLAALKKNSCNKWTRGASCVTCCTGNLCNMRFIGWINFFVFHLIYNSTLPTTNQNYILAENVSRAMEYELSKLTGVFKTEYCRLQYQKVIFSINCSVPDNVAKDEVFKQIFKSFNASQTLSDLGIQKDKMKLIGDMVCNEGRTTTTSHGTFYWPITKVGTHVTIPCEANVATRFCSSRKMIDRRIPTNQYMTSPRCSLFSGVWQEPDMSQCNNTEVITQQLNKLKSEDINKENVKEVSTELRNITKKSVYFKPKDVEMVVEIHEKMVPLISKVSANVTVKEILPSINDLINTPEEILEEAEQSEGAVKSLLDILESIPEEIPLEEKQKLTAIYSNVGIGVIKVEKDTFNGAVYAVSFGNKETEANTMIYNNSDSDSQLNYTIASISLPKSLFQHLQPEDRSAVSRISFLSRKDDKLNRVTQSSSTNANAKIISYIIAARIPNIKISNLDESVTITFNLIDQNATNLQCVYWDDSPGQNPRWSAKGCNTSDYVPGKEIICSCNHLTNFALLMNVYQDTPNSFPLSLISYLGCGISFVCLILTIMIHGCFKNLRKLLASKILINLCISLALTNLIFLVGIQPYAFKIPAACKAVAVLLHYFILTSFMWMAVEAFQICLAAIIVFQTYRSYFVLKSSVLAWGLPAVIVIITLAINETNNYHRIEHAQICWLSGIPFYSAFLAPVVAILVFNLIMFSLIIGRLITMQSDKLLEYEARRVRVFGIIGLVFLFGLSWVFAFFAVEDAAEMFQYLFVIFSTFQGALIFLLHCVIKEDSRDYICSCLCKQKEPRRFARTTKSSSSGIGTARTNT